VDTRAPSQESDSRRWIDDSIDWRIVFGLLLGFTLLNVLTFKPDPYGDGPWFIESVMLGNNKGGVHALFVPMFRTILGAIDCISITGMNWLSAFFGAVGLSATYVFVRWMGATPLAALFSVILVRLCLAVSIQLTIVELHGTHFMFSALAFACAARLRQRWSLPLVALFAMLYLGVYLSHTSGVLLAPAFALIILGKPGAFLGLKSSKTVIVGAALVATQLSGMWLATQLSDRVSPSFFAPLSAIQYYVQDGAPFLWTLLAGWIYPLALILCVSAFLLVRPKPFHYWLPAFIGIVPSVIFFSWLGYVEDGAYALGSMPLWALIMSVVYRRANVPLRTLAVAAALIIGCRNSLYIPTTRGPVSNTLRIETVQSVLPRGGVLLSSQISYPQIQCYVAEISEVSLLPLLRGAKRRKLNPTEFVDQLFRVLGSLDPESDGSEPRIVLDLSFVRDGGAVYELSKRHLDELELRVLDLPSMTLHQENEQDLLRFSSTSAIESNAAQPHVSELVLNPGS
jgi:hypothetical protein